MTWPLVGLAVPAAALGLVGLDAGWLGEHLGVPGEAHVGLLTSVLSVLFAAAGAGAVVLAWRREPGVDPTLLLARWRGVLVDAFYVDSFYDRVAVRPTRALARAVGLVDTGVVDAAAVGSGTSATRLAGVLRRAQAGNVQAYLTGLLAGVVLLTVGLVTLT